MKELCLSRAMMSAERQPGHSCSTDAPQDAVQPGESNALTLRPSKHVDLVAEGKNLQLQAVPALEAGAERGPRRNG
jgi:hypothetical protein